MRPCREAGSCCSDGLLHRAALEAAGADVCPGRLPLQENADALEVRVEAALRGHHGVAPVVTEAGLLPADCADLGPRPGCLADESQTAGVRLVRDVTRRNLSRTAGVRPVLFGTWLWWVSGTPRRAAARRRRPSRAQFARLRRPSRLGLPPARRRRPSGPRTQPGRLSRAPPAVIHSPPPRR